MLPDYAVGALDETESERIARHLDDCAPCRDELTALLEMIGLLTVTVPPRPEVKAALIARVAAEPRTAPAATTSPAPDPTPIEVASASPSDRVRPMRPARLPLWTGLAAALILLVGLGAWNLSLQRQLDERPSVDGFIGDTAEVHPLTDSQLSPPASGVLIVEPDSAEALLVAHGLPAIPADQRLQVWLFTATGERVSAGLLTANQDGHVDSRIQAPAPLDTYVAVAISAEPAAGSASPTTQLLLGGWLPTDR